MRIGLACAACLVLAGCGDRPAPDSPEPSGPSKAAAATIARDAELYEHEVRIANLEKRLHALEAEITVRPMTNEAMEVELLKQRLDALAPPIVVPPKPAAARAPVTLAPNPPAKPKPKASPDPKPRPAKPAAKAAPAKE